MASSPTTIESRFATLVRPRPRRSAFSTNLADRRRALQVALGLIWLLDAALQYQPYMFSRAFVSQVIQGGASGNPAVIADPITWSADFMARHIAVYNAPLGAQGRGGAPGTGDCLVRPAGPVQLLPRPL
jgi:hypothetical protein